MRGFQVKGIVIFCLLVLFGCDQKSTMKIEITSRETLKNIPSASGIELIQQEFWLMSDNSPWLFILNKELEPTNRIMIADTSDLVNGVIPKKDKHDLEGMMSFVYKGDSLLLLFGSGSKWPSRNSAILIDASTKKVRRTFDLTAFYSALMEEAKLEEDDLNIEAATVSRDELFLFNRGKNKLITMKLDRFMEYIFNERNSIKMKVYSVDLPEIDGIPAGFSGAVYNEESQRIYFTASVENTSDWVAEGTVLRCMTRRQSLRKCV